MGRLCLVKIRKIVINIISKNLLQNTNRKYWRLGMRTSTVKLEISTAKNITITEDALIVDLRNGRTIPVPLAWYPRLLHASQKDRNN